MGFLKPIHVSELEPDDMFIWADEHTREYMLCGKWIRDKAPEKAARYDGVLQAIEVNDDGDGSGDGRIEFYDTQRNAETFFYSKRSKVYRLPSGSHRRAFPMDMNCERCGRRFGGHSGLRCPTPKPGGGNTFLPSGKGTNTDDWFAQVLGL